MRIFLDSANIDEIKSAIEMGFVSGITTNPSLISKEGKPFYKLLEELTDLTDVPISAEVISPDYEGMIAEGNRLVSIAQNINIKIPISLDGLKAVKYFSDKGIDTNVTLIFTPNQALLAARAGATYVSPFVNRLNEINEDGEFLISQVASIFNKHELKTQIIAASIRSPIQVTKVALHGAHITTMPYNIMASLVHHPLTNEGIAKFEKDWNNYTKS